MSFGTICFTALMVFVLSFMNCFGVLKSFSGIKSLKEHHKPEDICVVLWMVVLTVIGISVEYVFIISKLNH